MGILKGIYQFEKESKSEYKVWAENTPGEYFEQVISEWKMGCKNLKDVKEMDLFKQFFPFHIYPLGTFFILSKSPLLTPSISAPMYSSMLASVWNLSISPFVLRPIRDKPKTSFAVSTRDCAIYPER